MERSRGHPVVGYENGLRGPFLPEQLLHSLLPSCFAKVGDTDQGVVQRYSRLLQGRAIAQETVRAGCSCQRARDASDATVPIGNEMTDRLDRACEVVADDGVGLVARQFSVGENHLDTRVKQGAQVCAWAGGRQDHPSHVLGDGELEVPSFFF